MRWIFWWALGCAALSAHGQPRPWPHEVSDLPVNPAVTWGRLDNGVRYAVAPNAEPAERVSLRLLVLAGSMHENERQRGYAHFVEHLAFDGTRLYPGQTLHATLQQTGLARGPDVNAHTHTDRTIYRLDLPQPTPERLRLGLGVLREFADGMMLDPAEVARESNVILIEKRARDSHSQRAHAAFMRFLFPAGPLTDPSAFGTEESIRTATAAELRRFYETWYRPENLVVVAVGAIEPAAVAREIATAFGSLPARAEAAPVVNLGPLTNPDALVVGVEPSTDAAGAASFLLASIAPVLPVDTRASVQEMLLRTMAFDALNRRLDLLQRRESALLLHASASYSSGPVFQQALLRIDTSPREWRAAVERLEQERRRALLHGFTPAEIELSRERARALLQHAATAERTLLSEPYADALAESIAAHRVFLAGVELEQIALSAVERATPEECLEVFRHAWGPGHPRLFASGPFTLARPAEQFAAVFRRSAQTPVKAPRPAAPVHFAYTDFGRPGKIVARDHVGDLDLHRIRFANGVRLNLKSTPFEAGRIVYGGRFGTGAAGEPGRLPGLRAFVEHGVTVFGLGRHDQHALRQLAAGQLSSLSITTGEEAFYIAGVSDRAGAERLLQLLAAQFTDPGWRASDLPVVQQRIVAQLDETLRNAGNYLTARRQELLTGGDSRYRLPRPGEVLRYTVRDFRRWFEPQLQHAPLEIGIVGDFDVEAMVQLASRTLGCLPRREPGPVPRPVRFLPQLPPTHETIPATVRQAAVQLAWSVPAPRGVRVEHHLELLADVLRNRLMQEIRGELGATYAASCQLWRSDVRRDTGYLIAALVCEPADVARIAETTRRIADRLARDGATAEEFERARQPRLLDAPVQLRSNGYWLGMAVAAAQSQTEELERPRQRVLDLEQATASDISALAAEVLPAERASVFTAAPEKTP
ncbi:M16 family metallopeptidase [Opitutus terrae]|uniref:Peptidase M16 domain protein n=1 Tax=Opitutus terrae (strain DSM 11246 / JCM 15787 / PB90-1) TaxID=452637 RepID=B1ZXP3_OPITP|nr:M16 family metallopeptidase [Opitutus terrae]ACB74265.1 peptidase M16 domain protein [Opitutus terrae PB90-1]